MPTALPPAFKLGTAQPKDAFAAFENRRLLAPSFRWEDVWQEEHAAGFAVAGVAQADVLKLFQDGIDQALGGGGSLADFAVALKPQLVAKGWWGDVEITDPATGQTRIGRFDDARLKLIYDVNLRQSYAAGRWARIERTRDSKPLVMYRTMRDERVRVSHARWDGVALPIDHPFWRTHYPPNGWRCRCRAFAVSERDLAGYEADGLPVKRDAPPVAYTEFVNRSTGEVSRVPVGIDPGFAYNPGQVRLPRVAELQRNALDAAPRPIATELVRQVVQSPQFAEFLARPLPQQWLPVGVLGAQEAAAMRARSTTVMLSDETVAKQARQHPDMAPADYVQVQLALDRGERLQDGPRTAIYLLEQDGWVVVVKATETGQGVFLTSLRRISSNQVRRDEEIRRLRAKKGADGGAPHSA